MPETLTLRDVLDRARSRAPQRPTVASPTRESVVAYLNETLGGPRSDERWNLAVEAVFRIRSQFGVSVLAFRGTTDIRFS